MSLPNPEEIDPPKELAEAVECPECSVIVTPMHDQGCPNSSIDPPFVWDCSRCAVQYAMSHQENCSKAPPCECCGDEVKE